MPVGPGGRLPEIAIEAGIGRPQVRRDLEIAAAGAVERDALDVDQAQQLAYRLGHRAAAFVARAAALGNADAGPEFLLVQLQPAPDFAGIGNAFKWFHVLGFLRSALDCR